MKSSEISTALSSESLSLTPPLKWAGGKRWLVNRLKPYWDKIQPQRLVEPFCGGLAIALGVSPKQALLNDINPHLINFYSWIQRGLTLDIDTQNHSDCYYQHRTRFNDLIEAQQAQTAEAAQLFYYLNRTGFNGLCRFNRRGLFNVPFGRYKTINYKTDFQEYQPVFRRWQFSQGDFASLALKEGDFIYADPPYDVEFRQYSSGGFDWSEQERLASWLGEQSVPVIASNQATERVLALYEHHGFEVTTRPAPRRISCNGDRTPAQEMLAFKGF
ncbi:DNA adenine methylase [Sodalinema gerasimenkoae]|uniref:DNA adenine methylase n=1 Tax=Sodalinema gerasimenkoae TaxID=2862348 RepID=UPI0013597D18|nr:Dam family site-specific DNA-(adenine-N6)-methyltransferase [Sodalinema gerasimenkoae]